MRRFSWRTVGPGLALLLALAVVVNLAWAGHPVTGQSLVQLVMFALPVAAIYAVSATGLVVVHSATGIFNFAQGAMGMVCAFVYWELSVNRGLPAWIALILVLAGFAPGMGWLLDKLLMRKLKRAPMLPQLVGTVGLLVALLGMATLIWNPNDSYPLQSLGPSGGIEVAGITLTWHRVITIAAAIALAAAVQVILRRTKLGISMRAVVDNEDVAALYGVRPGRVSATAWIIGAVSAALAGVLIAPEVGNMGAETLSLLIVNAFAAAVFGRLRSLSMTYVGALILGLMTTFSATFLSFGGRWNLLPTAIPALALFMVLLFMPQASVKAAGPPRTFPVERIPSKRVMWIWAAAFLAFAVSIGFVANATLLTRMVTAVSMGIILLGLVPLMGWAGIPFLAPLALGGFGAAITIWAGGGPLALVAAGVGTGLIGALGALPALRLRELYLALSSVALALVVTGLLLVQPEAFAVARTLEPVRVFGLVLDRPSRFLPYAAVVFLGLALLLLAIRRGRFGRRLIALRDSEAAAACVGINVAREKALVFVLAGAISGIGGGVLVQGARFGSVDQFPMIAGLGAVLSLTIWGVGTVSGPLIAAAMAMIFTTLAKDWAPGAATHALELVGPALAVLALSDMPRGQLPMLSEIARHKPWSLVSLIVGVGTGIATGVAFGLPPMVTIALTVVIAWAVMVLKASFGRGQLAEAGTAPAVVDPRAADPEVGLDRPFTVANVTTLDRRLGLEGAMSR